MEIYLHFDFLAVIMCEEGEELLENCVKWLQKQQMKLDDGFSIQFQGQEYTFLVQFIDR